MNVVELKPDIHEKIENGKEEVESVLHRRNHSNYEDKNSIDTNDHKNSDDNKVHSAAKATYTSSKKKKRKSKNKSSQAKSLNQDSIDVNNLELSDISINIKNTVPSSAKQINKNTLDLAGSSDHEITSVGPEEPSRPQLASPATLSPRKQTIMRYKKSDDKINEGSVINEIKGNLKASKHIPNERDDENKYELSNNINLDEKVTLFKYKSSRILIFHEQLNDSVTKSTGRLLAHGDFEVFQLHNGKVTYLSCGQSFIYPLLPKLKILRISFNQFILPLSNPERYWKIFINSEDSNVIEILENTFQKVVRYRNLFFSNNLDKSNASNAEAISNQPEEFNSVVKDTIYNYDNIPYSFAFSDDFRTIPESPPSVPISPHQESTMKLEKLPLPTSNLTLHPGWSLTRKGTNQVQRRSITSFNGNEAQNKLSSKQIRSQEFKLPITLQQRQEYVDTKSDSSGDSLLDEYEERISTSKSMNFRHLSISGPISRSSSAVIKNYGTMVQYNGYHKSELSDEFPTTSLSEYNRIRNKGISRKSSRSELYNSESNWMEPNNMYSKRNYAMTGYKNKNNDLNETYKNIYSSISSRNIHGYLEGDSKPRNNRKALSEYGNGTSRLYQERNHGSSMGGKNLKNTMKQERGFKHVQHFNSKDNTTLKSADIYNYIKFSQVTAKETVENNKEKGKSGAGFASKVFGWF